MNRWTEQMRTLFASRLKKLPLFDSAFLSEEHAIHPVTCASDVLALVPDETTHRSPLGSEGTSVFVVAMAMHLVRRLRLMRGWDRVTDFFRSGFSFPLLSLLLTIELTF